MEDGNLAIQTRNCMRKIGLARSELCNWNQSTSKALKNWIFMRQDALEPAALRNRLIIMGVHPAF